MPTNTSPNKALLEKILAFDIDGGTAPAFPFAARLARENGWTRAFAERVILEYKRFIYLAVINERAVCPSEAVDEAWHLHLTFTRSYWQRFCTETLGTSIHHDPTRGGTAEQAKHVAMYTGTLSAYRETFGIETPTDIWPPVEVRFPGAATAASQKASATANARLYSVGAVMFGAVALSLATSGDLNPFNLVGMAFLGVLIPLIVAATVAGRMIYRLLRAAEALPGDDKIDLDWQEAAYLAGGPSRLSAAVIARLVESGAAVVTSDKSLHPTGTTPSDMSPLETAVLALLPVNAKKSSAQSSFALIDATVTNAFEPRMASLTSRGLIVDNAHDKWSFRLAILPLLAVMGLLALPRLFLGLQAGRPVGFLVFSMIAGTILGLVSIAAAKTGFASPRGERALAGLRERHENLADGSMIRRTPIGQDLPGAELPAASATGAATVAAAGLAVALFGTAALAGSDIAELAALDSFFPRRTEAASSGCGGGGGGCGGGGGGGGCGGGGCGG